MLCVWRQVFPPIHIDAPPLSTVKLPSYILIRKRNRRFGRKIDTARAVNTDCCRLHQVTEVGAGNVFEWIAVPVFGPTLGIDQEPEGTAVNEARPHVDGVRTTRNVERVAGRIRSQRRDPVVKQDPGRIREERRTLQTRVVIDLGVELTGKPGIVTLCRIADAAEVVERFAYRYGRVD